MFEGDLLQDVLTSVQNRQYLPPKSTQWPSFALISWKTFSNATTTRIRLFQRLVLERFNISVGVIGGGYGCTKIVFSVEASTQEEAANFVLNVIDKPAFRALAVEAEFRVAIVSEPYIRTDLVTGVQELSAQAQQAKLEVHTKELNLMLGNYTNNVTSIHGDISDTNLAIGSTHNTMQLCHIPDNSELATQLREIRNALKQDQTIGATTREEAIELVDVIEKESMEKKPKRALLKSCADSLSSISSIGESLSKVIGLLGLGA